MEEKKFATHQNDWTSEKNGSERIVGGLGAIVFPVRSRILLALCTIPAALLCWKGGGMSASLRVSAAHLSIVLLAFLGAGKMRRGRASEIFVLACTLMLIALGSIHENSFLRGMNRIIVPGMIAVAMLAWCGSNEYGALSGAGIWETVRRSADGLFRYVPLPFVKLLGKRKLRTEAIGMAVVSLVICLPMVMLVALLLGDADAVFWSHVERMLSFPTLDSETAARIVLTAAIALGLFSWCFMLGQPAKELPEIHWPRIPGMFVSMLLPMLNAVYALFVYVQFSNLFGGAETAAMTGGYAQYARNGFFQLVIVAAFNLLAVSLAAGASRGWWVRSMACLTIGATGVILVSAAWRMRLYISVYGLTVLRVMTVWGMVVIGILMVVALIALFARGFRAFSVGLACVMVLWVGLNAIDIDAMIARHNVEAYLCGELAEVDEEYLRGLSGTEEALSRLAEKRHGKSAP